MRIADIRSAGCAIVALWSGCAQEPLPTRGQSELRVSEQVYDIFCKRVARDSYPQEPTGLRFDAACKRTAADALDSSMDAPRFVAMVERRQALVPALDLVFGDATAPDGSEQFESAADGAGELDQFLNQLVPFYDDDTIPAATRALGALVAQLSQPTDERAEAVAHTLARFSLRQGYRPAGENLAFTRSLLGYPGLDSLARKLLPILGADGKGNQALLKLLQATALELADAPNGVDNADSWLRVASELLLGPLSGATGAPYPEQTALAAQHFVRRDDDGNAIGSGSSPFPVPGREDPDADARDAAGRLASFQYGDAQPSLLAALLRELHALVASEQGPSTLAKLLHGMVPLLGARAARTYHFDSGRELRFSGPEPSQSPLLNLVHALATLLRMPETESMLALGQELLASHESDLAGLVYAALEVDRFADEDHTAKLTGWDGTADTPNEMWDDVIAFAVSMLDRPGQLEAVLRAYSVPSGAAQLALVTKFMKYSDEVTYPGARILPADVHSDEEVARFNAPISWQVTREVDRSKPDIGMNRSLWQRLVSTLNAVNGVEFCNKAGGYLAVKNPIGEGQLKFPNPAGQQGADALLTTIINLACSPPNPKTVYDRCGLLQQPNAAQAQMQAILGRFLVKMRDTQLVCLSDAGLAGDIGAEQEKLAQIKGYNLRPTPQAFARFVFVAPNKFTSDLVDPVATKHGVLIKDFEPNYTFALEAPQDDVLLDGKPASFMNVASDLGAAFDDHELFEDTPNGPIATQGYRYADMLTMFHQHWPSPRSEDCPAQVQAGNEGCSQRLDPSKPFYSQQSNAVSYEPLLIRAQQELQAGQLLQTLMARMASLWFAVDAATGAPRVVSAGTAGAKDGVTVLADFVTALIRPSDGVAYRDGRTWTHSNACIPDRNGSACESGRGRILPRTAPLYLVLDALHAADDAWKLPENGERHTTWLAGRSELTDQLLTVNKAAGSYALRNQRVRAIALRLFSWLRGTVLTELHPQRGDRAPWATGPDGLASRLEAVLGHPLWAHALELMDAVWDDRGALEQLHALLAYLLDDQGQQAVFLRTVLAAADTLEAVDRDAKLTPLVQFSAQALAGNALQAIAPGGPDPEVTAGVAYTSLELLRKVVQLPAYQQLATRTPLAKLLKNALVPGEDQRAPLEALFDASAEVNRTDPSAPAATSFDVADVRAALGQLAAFLTDPERGLERIYTVIKSRSPAQAKR